MSLPRSVKVKSPLKMYGTNGLMVKQLPKGEKERHLALYRNFRRLTNYYTGRRFKRDELRAMVRFGFTEDFNGRRQRLLGVADLLSAREMTKRSINTLNFLQNALISEPVEEARILDALIQYNIGKDHSRLQSNSLKTFKTLESSWALDNSSRQLPKDWYSYLDRTDYHSQKSPAMKFSGPMYDFERTVMLLDEECGLLL